MKASALEFRLRYWIHGALIVLGLWAPWNLLHTSTATEIAAANQHVWGILAANLAPFVGPAGGATNILTAFNVLLGIAIACAVGGALLRTWGTAYLGSAPVQDGAMQAAGGGIIEDGPYRHLRNPLYLGTILHVLALALLMSRSGAVFTIITIVLLQVRLILAEEAFLTTRLGQPYVDYCKRVPRLLPALRARISAQGALPRWLQGFLNEVYFWAVAGSFAFFGWRYNAVVLIQAVIVSAGVALIVRAIVPPQAKTPPRIKADHHG